MTLWDNQSAALATYGTAQGTWQAARVVIDSRGVQPGDLFVAIKGERFDGHSFVKEALAKGAVAMVSAVPDGVDQQARLLVVGDTLKGLEALGVYNRKRSTARVVGVTGSVGKTSTKEMLKLALSAHGKTYATSGNYNNHIGTPLNLANLPLDAEFAVFEMGMNHAGEISHLTQMVRPDIALITNVEAAHLEFFASLDAIADAKAEIFEGLVNDGAIVLNAENPHVRYLERKAEKMGISRMMLCGGVAVANCRLVKYAATRGGCAITAGIGGVEIPYTLSAVGRHWALTSLLTLAVTHLWGLSDSKTVQALAQFEELEGRGRITPIAVAGGQALIIDDSYNASPAAMRAAFAKTAEVWEAQGRKGRKLAALGNMLELGDGGPGLHAALAAELQLHGFDKIFTAGALMQHLHEALLPSMRGAQVDKAEALLPLLRSALTPDDILLIKGSHGSKMYEVAAELLPEQSEGSHAMGGDPSASSQENERKKHAV